jgi:hypothetical protein
LKIFTNFFSLLVIETLGNHFTSIYLFISFKQKNLPIKRNVVNIYGTVTDSIPHKLAHLEAQINCAPLGKFVW